MGPFRCVLFALGYVICHLYKEMEWEEKKELIVAIVTQNTEKFNELTGCERMSVAKSVSETDNDLKPAAKPVHIDLAAAIRYVPTLICRRIFVSYQFLRQTAFLNFVFRAHSHHNARPSSDNRTAIIALSPW